MIAKCFTERLHTKYCKAENQNPYLNASPLLGKHIAISKVGFQGKEIPTE